MLVVKIFVSESLSEEEAEKNSVGIRFSGKIVPLRLIRSLDPVSYESIFLSQPCH